MNLNLGPVAIRGHSILREEKHCQLRDTFKSFPLSHPPNPTSETNASNYSYTVLQTSEAFLGGRTMSLQSQLVLVGLGLSHTTARAKAFYVWFFCFILLIFFFDCAGSL